MGPRLSVGHIAFFNKIFLRCVAVNVRAVKISRCFLRLQEDAENMKVVLKSDAFSRILRIKATCIHIHIDYIFGRISLNVIENRFFAVCPSTEEYNLSLRSESFHPSTQLCILVVTSVNEQLVLRVPDVESSFS